MTNWVIKTKAQATPKWLTKRYAKLWIKFKNKEFDFDKAVRTLKEERGRVSTILSRLNKLGWLYTRRDPKNYRKSFYKLKYPISAMKEIAKKA